MDNTQLPAEVLENIELKAEHEAALHFNPKYSPDQNAACRICYRNGAKEYATKPHEVEQEIESLTNQLKNHGKVSDENMKLLRRENEQLRRWKIEAVELVAPIHAYVHKHIENSIGQCSVKLVLDRCKHFEQACALLEKFISRHEAGLLPDRFIYDEIKTFLDGK